jgi:hypothetical protein
MQSEYKTITKTKEVSVAMKSGGKFTYTYAPLDHILDEMRPLMAKHGFAITNTVNDLTLTVTLLHKSGEYIRSNLPLNRTSDPKALGSELTYMRRYGATCILGLATDDDDDGGSAAEGAKQRAKAPAKPRQQRKKNDASSDGGQDTRVQQIWINVRSLEATMQQYVDESWSGEDWLRRYLKDNFDKESTKNLETAEQNKLIAAAKKLSTDNTPPGEN